MTITIKKFIFILITLFILSGAIFLHLFFNKKNQPTIITLHAKNNLIYTFIPVDNLAFCQNQLLNKIYNRPDINMNMRTPINNRQINCDVSLYIYDVNQNNAKPITLADVQKLKLKPVVNDVMIVQYCTNRFTKYENPYIQPANSKEYKHPCLIQGNLQRDLNISYQPTNEFVFLGWVQS